MELWWLDNLVHALLALGVIFAGLTLRSHMKRMDRFEKWLNRIEGRK